CDLIFHIHPPMELLFVCLAAHDSEFRRWPDGVDRRICQTFAASPAEPGELLLGFSMGSFGIGSASHLAGELFKMMAGINLLHVPYRGGAPMITDLVGGQV